MERDEFALIVVGRALISDPAWGRKIQNGDTAGFKGFNVKDVAELV
ncbi:hypothetical protein [Caballeronia sordidicola]|uniref:Uncharacterized protein n=1 Tax=Caballeronia sordidicola TaxID=196367 RepID=A0A242MAE9_CABSO|nr:hypothetical protein [Caballeronia sordidicola]OTP68255.1 hypothetical protein PAMC26577_34325 [Caballeronia sordidicola]